MIDRMASRVATVSWPKDGAYRVARKKQALEYSSLAPEDADVSSGNRFDVVGGEVLYAGSNLDACFGETLGRMRPSPALMLEIGKHDHGQMNAGTLPQSWRDDRVIAKIDCIDPCPFVDVDQVATLQHISVALAPELEQLGYRDILDQAAIRGRDRRLTRLIARWAYTATTDDKFAYSGIKYSSRISGKWVCWAIFKGTEIAMNGERSIPRDEKSLRKVAAEFDLTVM